MEKKEFVQVIFEISFDKVEPIRTHVMSCVSEWYESRPDLVSLCRSYLESKDCYLSLAPDYTAEYEYSRMRSLASAVGALCWDEWWHEHCNLERVGA